MKDYELDVLKANCLSQNDCDDCPKETKELCKEFKRIIPTIHEPWELYRLTESGNIER